MSITTKQAQVLRVIIAYQAKHDGVSPSFCQIAKSLGLKSNSGVTRCVDALEERGFIRRVGGKGRARNISVLKNPDGSSFVPSHERIEGAEAAKIIQAQAQRNSEIALRIMARAPRYQGHEASAALIEIVEDLRAGLI